MAKQGEFVLRFGDAALGKDGVEDCGVDVGFEGGGDIGGS